MGYAKGNVQGAPWEGKGGHGSAGSRMRAGQDLMRMLGSAEANRCSCTCSGEPSVSGVKVLIVQRESSADGSSSLEATRMIEGQRP